MPLNEICTIGYEGATQALVLDRLAGAGVSMLLDIRAVPMSRKPGFSKRLLAASVEARAIGYRHLPGLGTPKPGREAARRGDVAELQRIFGAHMESDRAQADLALATKFAIETRCCLLCFERDHSRCHRSIVAGMIAERTGLSPRHL